MANIFSLKVCHFQYDHWLLFSTEMENINARRYVCKNLYNLDCQDSICRDIFQVA